jgi:hypothetical protein
MTGSPSLRTNEDSDRSIYPSMNSGQLLLRHLGARRVRMIGMRDLAVRGNLTPRKE